MALIHITFRSEALGTDTGCEVIVPQSAPQKSAGHPVLWLLHGMSDNQTMWMRRTSIERYASERRLAVVMPAAHLSRYANMRHGLKFYDYIAKELPGKMRGYFALSKERADNFIAGLSMGGAGSLKIGLANPEKYSAIGCLSASAPMFKRVYTGNAAQMARMEALVTGDRNITGTEEDMDASVKRILKENLPAPGIYHACGVDDPICENARKTRDYFTAIEGNPFGYVYEESPGAHTWEFWDEHIQHFLKFIFPPAI